MRSTEIEGGPIRVSTDKDYIADHHLHPSVSAIIVNYNSGDELVRCVASLKAQSYNVEIIVVDNGSEDGSVLQARLAYPEIRVVCDSMNDGFAGGANRGVAASKADMFVFLNPDVTLDPRCVESLIETIAMAGDVVAAPCISESGGHPVDSGFTVDLMGDLVALPKPGKPLFVSGCALATTRRVYEVVGGFDTTFFMFCEDLDFCWRALLLGYDVVVSRAARVRHSGGASTPGGYVAAGRLEVTAFRIALRERNAVATIVRCGPATWTAVVIAARLIRMVFIALIASIRGRSDLTGMLADGLLWNARRLPQLLRERRELRSDRSRRRQILSERMLRELSQMRALLAYGLPMFVDGKSEKVKRRP
jgi:GT2 family glycosyltransferase